EGKEVGFKRQTFLDAHVEATAHGFEAELDRAGSVGGDLARQRLSGGQQIRRRHHVVHQPQAEGFGGVDGVACEQDFERRAAADEPGQSLRAAVAGDEAELDLRLAQPGIVTGDAHGAGHGQLAATAQGEAVDGAEHRHGEELDGAEEIVAGLTEAAGGERVQGGDLADVSAGGEGLPARAGEDDGAQFGGAAQVLEDTAEFIEGGAVEGVELGGTVDRYPRQRPLGGQSDVFQRWGETLVGHGVAVQSSRLKLWPPAPPPAWIAALFAIFPSWLTLTTARARSPTACWRPPARSARARCNSRCSMPWIWSGSAASPSRRTRCGWTTMPATATAISST